MPQKQINIGEEPGNLGDGDSLRNAFSKTQDNFTELFIAEFVTDSSLEDHADASIPGTIAYALEQASQNGGGSVIVGPGIYNCNQSLKIRTNVRLIGSGRDTTRINATHFDDVISLGSGETFVSAQPGVEHLTIQLPLDSSASAIKGISTQVGNGYIQFIKVEGGNINSWGLTMDACNQFSVNGFLYHGEGSGMRWTNFDNVPFNYGDALISDVDIDLKNPGTTGILLLGNKINVINNILLSRIEIKSKAIQANTVGIELNRVSRITLINVDIENAETAVINGPQSKACAFINTYALGCTKDFVEIAPVSQTTIIGGDGDFADDQRLPSHNLKLYEPVFEDYTPVSTGIRDIEAYTDTDNPKQLSMIDSGSTIFTNKDASGTITFILPDARNSKSLEYTFSVVAGNEMRIFPGSNDGIRGYDGTTSFTPDGGYIYSSIPGTTGTIRNVDNVWWIMDSRVGTWDVG